jgi:hypothetical protein
MSGKTSVIGILLLFCASTGLYAQPADYRTSSTSAAALFSTGIIFMELHALVNRPILVQTQYNIVKSFETYSETGTGYPESAWPDRFGLMSLGQWTAGALFTGSTLLLPPEQLTISIPGKIGMLAGMALAGTGALFDLASVGALVETDYSYSLYIDSGGQFDSLYGSYERAYTIYKAANIVGRSLRGAGGFITAISLALPGSKSPLAPASIHKVLFASSLLLITGGVYAKHAASIQALRLNDLYEDYAEAGDPGAAYAVYRRVYNGYAASTVLAYGLNMLGGAAAVAALFLPAGNKAAIPKENRTGIEVTAEGSPSASRKTSAPELTYLSIVPDGPRSFHLGFGLTF